METYNYDESSAAADASTASANVPAAPGFGPLGPVTPTVPDPSMDNSPAALSALSHPRFRAGEIIPAQAAELSSGPVIRPAFSGPGERSRPSSPPPRR